MEMMRRMRWRRGVSLSALESIDGDLCGAEAGESSDPAMQTRKLWMRHSWMFSGVRRHAFHGPTGIVMAMSRCLGMRRCDVGPNRF